MSELLDRQVNVQIESLKKLGFTQAPAGPHDENETKKKQCISNLMERSMQFISWIYE